MYHLLQSLQYHLARSLCNQAGGPNFSHATIRQLFGLIAAIEEHYFNTSRLQNASNEFCGGVNPNPSLFTLQTVTTLSVDVADSNIEVDLGLFFPKDQSAATLLCCLVYPLAEEHQTKVLRQTQTFLPISVFQAVLTELRTLLHPQVWVKLCSCMPEMEDYSSAFKTKSPLRVTKQLLEYIKSVSSEDKNDQVFYEKTTSQAWSMMQIPYDQGKFITFLVKALKVKTALELGTYTGYSSYAIVRGMGPEGKLITCDINEQWTAIARNLWEYANVASQIELKVGEALDTLQSLAATHHEEFDFIFIDCDKENYDAYFDKAITLLKKGGVIAIDNVLWQGLVSEETTDETTNIIKRFNAKVAKDTKIDGLCITTIGDGLTLAIKQ